jgi:signal peptidase II
MTFGTPVPDVPDPLPPQATPSPTSVPEPRFARPFELGVMLAVILLDQLTKVLVRQSIALGESRTIITGFLDLTHVQNTGAAFGLLNSVDFPYKPWIMIGVASIALIAIAAYGTQLGFHDRMARMGLALILGGAFGNLMDRAIMGHVTDFVDIYWGNSHFWAFNVADAAINVGAALVLIDMIGLGRRHASDTV